MSAPRAVIVTRQTDYEALIARHGTREQARFFLQTHGQRIEDLDARHERFQKTLAAVSQAIPSTWRRTHIARADLDRFLFEPEDVIACVGQDGLVANVAKYLTGQLVVGVNADPERFDGILVPHRIEAVPRVFATLTTGRVRFEARTMVCARTDDGQRLLAVNEIYVGHKTHQSARYRIIISGKKEERHSSSGVVIATGTGSTGWARSISLGRGIDPSTLPRPSDPKLAYFVREPFPSVATGTTVREGTIEGKASLAIVSEMNEGGTLFGDGIEEDAIDFRFGLRVDLAIAEEKLVLVR